MKEKRTKPYKYQCKWCQCRYEAHNRNDAKRKVLSHYIWEHKTRLLELIMSGAMNKYLIEQVED